MVEAYNEYVDAIQSIHLTDFEKKNWREIQGTSAPFHPDEKGPLEKEAIQIYENYSPSIVARIIKKLAEKEFKKRKQAIFQARKEDQQNYRAWKETQSLADGILQGEERAYKQALRDTSFFRDFQKNDLQIKIPNKETVEVEVTLPLVEIVPKETLTLTKTGKVSKRKMGKMAYYRLAKNHVCSTAIHLAQVIFATLPVEKSMIHLKQNRLNTATGYQEDVTILSVIFDQKTLSTLHMERINPGDAMVNFQHEMDYLKTKGFRPVKKINRLL